MRTLDQLLQVPLDDREADWEDEFLTLFSQSKLKVLSPEPQTGPDSWPYMMAAVGADTDIATDQGLSDEPSQKLLAWLAERGIGLVINPMKEFPDFVLTYGMIWGFRETGRFIDRRILASDGEVEYAAASLKMSGAPTEAYLPGYVRKILRQFWNDQGVLQPRVQVLSMDGQNFDFALSLESLGNPPAAEHADIAEAIAWFLPPHYSVVLISEKGLPPFGAL